MKSLLTRKIKPDEGAMAKVNDVVLIYLEDAPVSFARVENILPDAKKDWYHIKLLMLQIPMQVVTWILKDEYINGLEFHMNGKKMKLEEVKTPIEEPPFSSIQPAAAKTGKDSDKDNSKVKNGAKPKTPTGKSQKKDADIISFSDLKKNHGPESG